MFSITMADEEPNDGVPGSHAGKAPTEPLPDLETRIERAKEAARERRRELGLPELPAEELEVPAGGRKSGKRTKNHRGFQGAGSAAT